MSSPLGPHRFWGRAPLPEADRTPVQKLSAIVDKASTSAQLRLYDPIDSYGGEFGVSAKEFAQVLDGLPTNTETLHLHINSPGGEVFDAIAIANSLRNHPARVVAYVDGLAASSASFIAASADEVVAGRNSQMMVHDAMGVAIGNAKTMQDMLEALDKISNNIASFYAEKTGGTVEDWRAVMLAETWYTAEEAVEAGLADRVEEKPADSEAITNRFDLSIFNYAGREHAPAPKLPTASAGGSTHTEGGSAVAFSDEQMTNLRAKLQLPETADEAAIVAAISAVVDESLEDRPDPADAPSAQPATPSAPAAQAPASQPVAATPGTMVIDSSAWEEREERIRRLEAADKQRKREERDAVIAEAVGRGKFRADRADHWKRLWDADPEGTRQVIDGLASGIVPINELGHASDDQSIDDEFGYLFPPSYSSKGA